MPEGTELVRVPQDARSGDGWHYDERGWIEVDQTGATLSGISTTRSVNITASSVTVQNSRIIVSGEDFGIAVRHADNVTLRNNDIAGPASSGPTRLMNGIKDIYSDSANLQVIGNDISNTACGVQTDQGLIEDNYIHDLAFTGDDHVNGTTSNGGSRPLTIRHNTIFNPQDQTDAVSLFQDFGPQNNRVIDDNLLAGGGYTIYAGANAGKESSATNISVTNNRISRVFYPKGGFFGYATAYTTSGGNSWEGNVWDDTGDPIPAP
ncbi:right-handed parallel beta-helix repeat-containing protein [Aeromicrobium wangtongii]|uniref:Right-handed parallel beta-helix repeat-containing protein n=1 Tax=Aeromicrobium wangtongii TaxID=2969247 RepID=A0ABY5MEM6_9ACTN|nr:right-handed parallel beta-helix repeat-containing protein [Aeromicrobium wangtongii]MCD9196886.1 right-handed parallel beta-helix repeat-containing protein [Aeromicrobium wangtongii]UUP15475.1 right-handed parallel beta-helix repeat-containing protein [Aeromicrobium wangtongii]